MFFRKKKTDGAPKKKRSSLIESLVVGLVIGGAVGSIVGKNLIEEKEKKKKSE
jgi:uncharacterized membrane protein YsdA (DUF1294 family)